MTIIPTAGGNPPAGSSGYASLTGTGRTKTPGELVQTGSWRVVSQQVGGIITLTNGTVRVSLSGTTITIQQIGAGEKVVVTGNGVKLLGSYVSIGRSAGSRIGFYGASPTQQQATAIATPEATVTSLKTAVDDILKLLRGLGLVV